MSEKNKSNNPQGNKQSSSSSKQKPLPANKGAKETDKLSNPQADQNAQSSKQKSDNHQVSQSSTTPLMQNPKDSATANQKPLSANKDSGDDDKATQIAIDKQSKDKLGDNAKATIVPSDKHGTSHQSSASASKTSKQAPHTPSEQKLDASKRTNQADLKKDKTTTDSTTPPPRNPPKTTGNTKGGKGLSYLALAVALAAAGLGVYNLLNKDDSESTELTSLQQRLAELESAQQNNQSQDSISALNDQVSQLQAKLTEIDAQKIMSEEDVTNIVEQQVSNKSPAITPEQIKEYVDSELTKAAQANASNAGLSQQEVQTQIKQALASFSQDTSNAPKFDFSEEIAKIEQSEQKAQQAVERVNQRASEIQSSIEQQVQSIRSEISQIEQRANPYPILDLLRLANASAQLGQAAPTALYLEQAAGEFASFNLDQAPYANFKAEIEQKAKAYRSLAETPNAAQKLDSIIANIEQWPFKQANASDEDEKSAEQTNEDTGFMASIKGIGKNILDNTVSVTRNDEDGLSWINENVQLQQLIRQNVRLDLAYARNALIYQDTETFNVTAKRLQENIARYFDAQDSKVSQAIDTLENIQPQQADFPNLSDLIEQFSQTASKE